VHGLHPLAARALRVRYRFPAECWEAPTTAVDGADIPVPSVLSELECPAVT